VVHQTFEFRLQRIQVRQPSNRNYGTSASERPVTGKGRGELERTEAEVPRDACPASYPAWLEQGETPMARGRAMAMLGIIGEPPQQRETHDGYPPCTETSIVKAWG
jgi:hypothetical protein